MTKSAFFSIKRAAKQKGFIAVTFAVMATVLVGFAGMAVDTGYMQWNKRRVQLAADAAAMGALRELEKNAYGEVLVTAGRNDASLNGFTNGVNQTTVEIHNPPISGAYSGDNLAVQAVVRRNFPTLFMRIFGQNSIPIAADAVARTTTNLGNIGGCIFALNKTMKNALNINGTSLDLFTNCSIVVESTHGEAFTMGGGAILNLGHEARVGVVGGWSLLGQTQIRDISYSPPQPRSPEHIEDPGDPFAAMPEPSVSNVSDLTIRANNGVTYSKNSPPAQYKIWPGVYCGGIKIGDTNGIEYTFMPGVYILAGGGLDVGSSAKAKGTGLMFYNTGSGGTNYTQWGCANRAYTPLSITGQGEVNLTAQTSGTFVGMLFFSDRKLGSGSGKYDQVVGGAGNYFNGALYFKRSNLKFAGGSSNTGYVVLVADNISIVGGGTLGNNYSTLANPNPFAPYSTGGGMVE